LVEQIRSTCNNETEHDVTYIKTQKVAHDLDKLKGQNKVAKTIKHNINLEQVHKLN